jgi:SAM-dependent methyltransferase
MHQEVEDFVQSTKQKMPKYFFHKDVLEVGSWNVNGSVRKFFTNCEYIGIDLHEGKDVDIICRASEINNEITIDHDGFDVVISCEMLEHDWEWKLSLESMYDNLKSGGLLLITCAAPNRPEHGTTEHTPQDSPSTQSYYRNISMEDFRSVLPDEMFSFSSLEIVREGMDLLFYGIKK